MEMGRDKQREVLKYMLERIYRADKHKKQLDKRLKQLHARRQFQEGAEVPEDEPTSVKYWQGDIGARILEQKKEIDRAVTLVMNIIDYLPINSVEREICELRHIDLKPWGAVSAEIPMSRSQVYKRHRNALKILLSNQRIQSMTAEYEGEYDAYIQDRGQKN